MSFKQATNINFAFYVLFICWCLLQLKGNDKSDFHKELGFEELNILWALIILSTSFNLFSRFKNRLNCYLIGAVGMSNVYIAQLIFVLAIIRSLLTGDREKRRHLDKELSFILLTFPFILFGIQSSLYCYQQSLNEKTGQNKTKFQRSFLKCFIIDYQSIVLSFNVAVSLVMGFFFCMVIEFNRDYFHVLMFAFLAPLIPTAFCFLAMCTNQKKYYRGTIICWAIFGIVVGFLSVAAMNQTAKYRPHQFFELYSLLLSCIINTFVGFFSAISYYHSEGKSENAHSVSYNTEEENVIF